MWGWRRFISASEANLPVALPFHQQTSKGALLLSFLSLPRLANGDKLSLTHQKKNNKIDREQRRARLETEKKKKKDKQKGK